MFMRIFFALISMLCCSLSVSLTLSAQTLDSLLSEAMRNNPQVRAYTYTIQAAEHRVDAAGALPPPQAGVAMEQVQVGNFNIINGALSNNFYASQMFMPGGKLGAMQDMERVRVQTERDRQNEYIVKLRADITTAYVMLWRIDRQKEILENVIGILARSIEVVASQVEVGKLPLAEILRLQGERASLVLKTKTLANERLSSQAMLNSFLGRSNRLTPIETTLRATVPNEALFREQVALLAERNPTLKRMTSMIAMTRAEVTATEKEAIPDVMVQGMIMRMPQGMTLTANSPVFTGALESPFAYIVRAPNAPPDFMYSLMAQITLPFAPWSSPKYTAKTQELTALSEAQTLERENMERMFLGQIEEQLQRLRTAQQTIETLEQTIIPLYEQTLDAQVSALQTNQTTITALLDTERMLLMKSDERIMAREQLHVAIAQLEALMGVQPR